MHFAHLEPALRSCDAILRLTNPRVTTCKDELWASSIVTFFDDMMATDTTPKAAQLIVVIDTSALEPGNC